MELMIPCQCACKSPVAEGAIAWLKRGIASEPDLPEIRALTRMATLIGQKPLKVANFRVQEVPETTTGTRIGPDLTDCHHFLLLGSGGELNGRGGGRVGPGAPGWYMYLVL